MTVLPNLSELGVDTHCWWIQNWVQFLTPHPSRNRWEFRWSYSEVSFAVFTYMIWVFSYDWYKTYRRSLFLLANPEKLIQKFFRNLSFPGHEPDRVTRKLIHLFWNFNEDFPFQIRVSLLVWIRHCKWVLNSKKLKFSFFKVFFEIILGNEIDQPFMKPPPMVYWADVPANFSIILQFYNKY